MLRQSLVLFLSSSFFLQATDILEQYKTYLEKGTYEGQDWSPFRVIPASRYVTFKMAFDWFTAHQGKVIVELGTSRSFVHGGLPGCNSKNEQFWQPTHPETWDWGAGFFTRMATECLQALSPEVHTVDISAEHIRRCALMTAPFRHLLHYHVCSSIDFLKSWDLRKKIDLLYLDTGDMTPIESTAQLQLAEARAIVERDLIAPHGIILIDDVKNQTPKKFGETSDLGKAKYAIPYLLSHGYEILYEGYQVILKKAG